MTGSELKDEQVDWIKVGIHESATSPRSVPTATACPFCPTCLFQRRCSVTWKEAAANKRMVLPQNWRIGVAVWMWNRALQNKRAHPLRTSTELFNELHFKDIKVCLSVFCRRLIRRHGDSICGLFVRAFFWFSSYETNKCLAGASQGKKNKKQSAGDYLCMAMNPETQTSYKNFSCMLSAFKINATFWEDV